MASFPRDENRVPVIGAVSDVDSTTPVPLEADPTTKRLKVDAVVVPGTAADALNGGDVTVGTTEVEMTFTGTTTTISIQADHDNTGTIWIGPTGVTNTGTNAFKRLEAGESVDIDVDDASAALYAISGTASQKVFKVALT